MEIGLGLDLTQICELMMQVKVFQMAQSTVNIVEKSNIGFCKNLACLPNHMQLHVFPFISLSWIPVNSKGIKESSNLFVAN